MTVPAEARRTIDPDYLVNGLVSWSIAYSLPPGSAPISRVVIEFYACGEKPQDTIQSLPRQTNIGNTVPTTTIGSLVNDGNAAGTQVVEATPSGSATSGVILTNDGALTLAGGLLKISTAGVFTAVPAGALPVAALASGALPSGVTIGASQVGSGYPAASLAAGALPSGVTIGAAQLTTGALASGVTIGAAQITAGVLGGSVDMTNITSDGGAFSTNGTGLLAFARTLGASNQLMDWQQSYGLYSDNAATTFGGSNRLWFQAGGATQTQEMHFGSRAGAALAGVRFLTANLRIDGSGATTPGTFQVMGGVKTSLDAATITTDGSGNLTATSFHGLLGTATAGVGVNFKDQSGNIEFDAAGAARGILFAGFDGTSLHAGLSIGTDGTTSLGTVRNAVVTVVPIYTGTTTPTSPPTGAIWIKA